MADMMRAAIAANRFGLGARPGDLERIAPDPEGWLKAQLRRKEAFLVSDPRLDDSLKAGERLAAYRLGRKDRKEEMRANPGEGKVAATATLPPEVQQLLKDYRKTIVTEIEARMTRALITDDAFAERLAVFWSNHFTVAATKLVSIPYAGPFEREAIRQNLTGTFHDLLLAVARHPGMLLYLDQAQSIGPDSLVGKRRDKGLNENLAREILELHTLGPQGGYTQADVTEFARALTGWTIAGPRLQRLVPNATPGAFVFVEQLHEPGERVVLGKRYGDRGEGQALAILADLSAHPSTAHQVATQLCRHFIADSPPPAAVARLERAFTQSNGALPAVHEALVAEPEAWAAEPRKFKTPNDFVSSALRLAGIRKVDGEAIAASMELLGQPTFRAPSPKGWPDVADAWAGPDAVMKRLEWAQEFADKIGAQARPEDLAAGALGPTLSPRTSEAVHRAQTAQQGLTIAVMSPEFQRR